MLADPGSVGARGKLNDRIMIVCKSENKETHNNNKKQSLNRADQAVLSWSDPDGKSNLQLKCFQVLTEIVITILS